MNIQNDLASIFRADGTLVSLIQTMTDDARATGIYTTPLDPQFAETAEAFLTYPATIGTELVFVPRPSLYINPGRPNPHPAQQTSGIGTLIAVSCEAYVYAPTLDGIDGYGVVQAITGHIVGLLLEDGLRWRDTDTGLMCRAAWFGSLGPTPSPEFPETVFDYVRIQVTTRLRVEE